MAMKNSVLKIFLLNIILFLPCFAFSQNMKEITGKIETDSNSEEISGAQISVLKEGNVIKEFFSDEKGNFSTLLSEGKYILLIEEFGYEKKELSFSIGDSSINLGTIVLKKIFKEKEIEGVVVLGKKTTIVNQIDRKVVTVGDDLTGASQDLSQVMNTIPGIYVNQDNQISLRGSSNVKILVDGKPTTISFEQIMRQYPPDLIDKIEVLTNPPAKYSPEGKSGIINIILKKGSKKGTNINLNTNYIHGANSKYTTGIDFNQGFEKFNIFGSGTYNVWNWKNSAYLFRESTHSLQTSKLNGEPINRSGKIGFDYFLNDKNTLSLYTYQSGNNSETENNSLESSIYDEKFYQQNYSYHIKNQEYDLFYKSEFAKSGHKIEVQANYDKYYEDTESNSTLQGLELWNQKEENFRANLDYTNPLSNNSELTAGAEFRLNKFKDKYGVLTKNFYEFDRDIYSLYVEYKKEWTRLGIKAGIRGEYSDTRTNTDFANSKNFKDYTYQIYPTLHAGYKLGKEKKTEISFNYSRRIDRPWAGLFSPVPQFSIGTIVYSGNENIKPEYTNSYEMGISTNLSKLYIGANIFIRDIKDQILQRFIEQPTYIEIVSENTEGNNQYGGELDINYNPFKWWSINSGFEYYWGKISGTIQNKWSKRNIDSHTLKINNTFTLPKSISVQLFGFYKSKNKDLQNNYKEQWKIDLSVKKAFMDDKLSFTVRISDLFNAQHSQFNKFTLSYIDGRFDWESRRISLAVKYTFANGKIKKTERKEIKDNTKKEGGNR